MSTLKRRHFVAGAAALGLGAAVALRPGDRGGPHDAYFQTLQRALQDSGPALPTLVVDRQRLLANLDSIAKTTQPGLALRVVVKSLPSLTLIEHALKAWRTEVAREHDLPAYLIFPNSTLNELAARNPGSLDAVATVTGVGAKKLEAYGRELLRVLESSAA